MFNIISQGKENKSLNELQLRKLKRMIIWSVDEDVEELEISYIAGKRCKMVQPRWKNSVTISYTAKHT